MRRNILTTNKKGFSLIELCIVMVILAVLTGSIAPIFIKRVQIKAGEKTAMEMSSIEHAALAYYVANNAWPLNVQVLQSSGYLNPSWVTNNAWQNPYTVSSTQNSFTVSTTVPSEWTRLVARDLPTSSILQNSVSSTVPSPGAGALPSGAIIMWSGKIADIPLGWALCNGLNGTPDLRDRFIVGARQDDAGVAKTNVSGSLTLNGGEAYHKLTIAEMPSHTHSESGHFNHGAQHRDDNVGAQTTRQTGATGGDQPHNNLPPYYALAYIMKL